MSRKAKLSLLVALAALGVVWGLVAVRIRRASETTVQGALQVGSLSCPGPCRIELGLSDGTRVTSRECALPDALRDVSGVHVVAAGKWTSPRVLEASYLFVTAEPKPSGGLPVGCTAR